MFGLRLDRFIANKRRLHTETNIATEQTETSAVGTSTLVCLLH